MEADKKSWEDKAAMCHHYVSAKDPPPWVNLVPEFSERVDFSGWQQRAFWPLDDVPILRLGATGKPELAFLQWGLLPTWWKPSGKQVKRSGFQRKCVNAVSEEVAEKSSFREAFRERRCLMMASEFAETIGGEQWFFTVRSAKPSPSRPYGNRSGAATTRLSKAERCSPPPPRPQ